MRGRSLRPCSGPSEGLLRAGMVAPLFAGIGPRTAGARKEAPPSQELRTPPPPRGISLSLRPPRRSPGKGERGRRKIMGIEVSPLARGTAIGFGALRRGAVG